MPQVLIVSKTRMNTEKVCVGGFDIENRINVRLLTDGGANQPVTCNFHIGEIWNIHYVGRATVTPPHTEDVLVQQSQIVRVLNCQELRRFIEENCPIVNGSITNLFGGQVNIPLHHASHVSEDRVPDHSVCFWRPDVMLSHEHSFEKDKYRYFNLRNDTLIAYVGLVQPLPILPAGTLVRMSLARWWTPPGSDEPACYLQVSGWY